MASSDVNLEWVRPPLQARSQQTLSRLLDAAEAIIEDKGLDNATVSEIARRAGSSVGAFYARFSDKEGLLRSVFERFNEQALATADVALEARRWDGVPLGTALELMILFMIRVLRERRGLMVAMFSRTAVDPSLTAFGELLHGRIAERLLELIDHRDYAPAHPDPDLAVHVVVWMVLSSLQSRVVYHAEGDELLTDPVVAREISRVATSFLGIAQESPRRGVRAGVDDHPRPS